MDRSGFQGCYILGFVLCLASGGDSCDGYSHRNDTEFFYGVLGQNITLSCELQSTCVIGLWAFRTSSVKYLNAGSCSNCGESFSVSDIINGDIMYSSLHINYINERLTGIYDCSCQYENGADKKKCFNLQIKNASCQLELTRNEKVKVFGNSSGSQHKAIRTVNVNFDDNITARCVSDAAKLNINCKNRSGLLKIKETKDRCRISCRINNLCETRIILSAISSTTHSPSTSTTKKEVTRSTKLTITKTRTVTFATSPYTPDRNSSSTSTRKEDFTQSTKPTITRNGTVTFATSQYTTERKSPLPYTMSKEETYLISTSSVKTTSTREQTKVTSLDDGITAIVSTTYTGKKVTVHTTMMSVVILAAFIVILLVIILVLSLKILKGKRKRSAEKEEWINPIYEGFEEGRERDGSTEHEISIIASQPDQDTLDEGVYHYIVTSNSKPIHES
ncbi:hypothetical protein BSL78_01743 [Apostichopus japonicus]|uniref:Immunoglobulin subtype domain-containing protein n=1 Tax=Stichopus japonicus TaxID=307972 RepID=A0A2G8LM48_STIJA|nr:hypothetical protein BSL78_01743 [Apostichopus japonicus]